MKNVTKKIATYALATVAAVAAAQSSHAALVTYQLSVDPSNAGFNTATNYSVIAGQTVTLDVYALLVNTNGNGADDGVNVASLVFTSGGTAAAGVYQNAALATPFQATGTVGSASGSSWGATAIASNSVAGDFDPSAASTVTGTNPNPNPTTNILLGTVQYVVATGATNGTNVILTPNAVHKATGTTTSGTYSIENDGVVNGTTSATTFQASNVTTLLLPAGGSTTDISLTATATHTVIGQVTVLSSGPNQYAGQVLNLGAGNTTGSVGIGKPGSDPTEVLLWISGDSDADAAALTTALGANGTLIDLTKGGLDADAAALLANYTGQGVTAGLAASGPTFLVRFPTNGDASPMDFNFTLPTTTLVGITAVPEPASLGLLAMGGLGLLARRRRASK